MTISGFLIGMTVLGLGFLMVWRRKDFRNSIGDLGAFFDVPGSSWLTWEILGSFLMFAGFMLAFGIFQLFIEKLFRALVLPTIG